MHCPLSRCGNMFLRHQAEGTSASCAEPVLPLRLTPARNQGLLPQGSADFPTRRLDGVCKHPHDVEGASICRAAPFLPAALVPASSHGLSLESTADILEKSQQSFPPAWSNPQMYGADTNESAEKRWMQERYLSHWLNTIIAFANTALSQAEQRYPLPPTRVIKLALKQDSTAAADAPPGKGPASPAPRAGCTTPPPVLQRGSTPECAHRTFRRQDWSLASNPAL